MNSSIDFVISYRLRYYSTSKRGYLTDCNNEKEINPRAGRRQMLHEKTSIIYGALRDDERNITTNDVPWPCRVTDFDEFTFRGYSCKIINFGN